jgi:hypothetical protein
MQNSIFGPYLEAIKRILVLVMPSLRSYWSISIGMEGALCFVFVCVLSVIGRCLARAASSVATGTKNFIWDENDQTGLGLEHATSLAWELQGLVDTLDVPRHKRVASIK